MLSLHWMHGDPATPQYLYSYTPCMYCYPLMVQEMKESLICRRKFSNATERGPAALGKRRSRRAEERTRDWRQWKAWQPIRVPLCTWLFLLVTLISRNRRPRPAQRSLVTCSARCTAPRRQSALPLCSPPLADPQPTMHATTP